MKQNQDAIEHLESAVVSARWIDDIVLRYGWLYGEGTSMSPCAETFKMIEKRMFPIVGDGGAVWSFIHVKDAAEATVAAIERGHSGIYNVVDDHPTPVAEWLPLLARQIGPKRPFSVPCWLGRLFAGKAGVVMMTELRGASNNNANSVGGRLIIGAKVLREVSKVPISKPAECLRAVVGHYCLLRASHQS